MATSGKDKATLALRIISPNGLDLELYDDQVQLLYRPSSITQRVKLKLRKRVLILRAIDSSDSRTRVEPTYRQWFNVRSLKREIAGIVGQPFSIHLDRRKREIFLIGFERVPQRQMIIVFWDLMTILNQEQIEAIPQFQPELLCKQALWKLMIVPTTYLRIEKKLQKIIQSDLHVNMEVFGDIESLLKDLLIPPWGTKQSLLLKLQEKSAELAEYSGSQTQTVDAAYLRPTTGGENITQESPMVAYPIQKTPEETIEDLRKMLSQVDSQCEFQQIYKLIADTSRLLQIMKTHHQKRAMWVLSGLPTLGHKQRKRLPVNWKEQKLRR